MSDSPITGKIASQLQYTIFRLAIGSKIVLIMEGKGLAARRARAGQNYEGLEEEYKQCPHSFIFNRGHVGKNINNLILDLRRVMEPFTASHLKARKSNVLKDFVSVAGSLNVSHFLTFTKTEISTYLRIMRLPRGPTLTFKINSYSLSKDIISSLKRHHMDAKQFLHHPLLILNKFSGEGLHLKLMSTTFQNLFPAIHINKMKLNDVRRCVLLNYNPEDKTVEFRHYNIRVVPVGLSKTIKKLVGAKVPDMSQYNDISEFIDRDGNASESEAEVDGPHNEVTLPQNVAGRGNIKSAKSAIRLTEIGPRMTLQLVKIEEGLCQGDVLYHEFVHKTEEEKESLQKMRATKRKLKELRKQEQEANVQKKTAAKEEAKIKTLEGMKRAEKSKSQDDDDEAESLTARPVNATADSASDDDDAKYFEKEVGAAPDGELFPAKNQLSRGGKRGAPSRDGKRWQKKPRLDDNDTPERGRRTSQGGGNDRGHTGRGRGQMSRGKGRSRPGQRNRVRDEDDRKQFNASAERQRAGSKGRKHDNANSAAGGGGFNRNKHGHQSERSGGTGRQSGSKKLFAKNRGSRGGKSSRRGR